MASEAAPAAGLRPPEPCDVGLISCGPHPWFLGVTRSVAISAEFVGAGRLFVRKRSDLAPLVGEGGTTRAVRSQAEELLAKGVDGIWIAWIPSTELTQGDVEDLADFFITLMQWEARSE